MADHYLLFAGRLRRTRGGWHDYAAEFARLEDAMRIGEAALVRNGGREHWYHVVDARTLRVVASGGEHPTEPPRIEV